ncbi:MAG: hypothetical protein Q7R31_01430 [Candidatus Levybacteria bacterium]|nr:hypothetical protein [Candidatus Levybacteria bacterium]
MSMQHLENELRRTGDPRKQAFADVIAGIHKSLGSDIPLPSVATPEKQLEIKRFSQEQREALEKQGFVSYGLTGQSIKALRDSGHKFWSDWHKSLPDFEALGSMHSEVAINPSKLFLPKSNNKTLAQQEEMVSKFSEELGKKVKGVKAIIGQAPDYVELAFAHLDATKEYLFGAKDNYDYARTKTPTGGSYVASVGRFIAADGLGVGSWDAGYGYGGVHAAPLVVPV